MCIVAGYGHFLPFGGVPFDLQSSCTLRLATTECGEGDEDGNRFGGMDSGEEVPGGLPRFQLSVRSEERDTGQAIWVRGFVLEVYGYEIEVSRSFKHTVTVRHGKRVVLDVRTMAPF